MPIELKMPALSPTMEEGTLAKWLVKEGDTVESGDILAEIETDKATMEFEAVDEGTIAKILVPEGTDGVKVGDADRPDRRRGRGCRRAAQRRRPRLRPRRPPRRRSPSRRAAASAGAETPGRPPQLRAAPRPSRQGDRVKASPLARRLAEAQGIDLAGAERPRPRRPDRQGRRRRRGRQGAGGRAAPPHRQPRRRAAAASGAGRAPTSRTRSVKLSNMRKTIARRLTEVEADRSRTSI